MFRRSNNSTGTNITKIEDIHSNDKKKLYKIILFASDTHEFGILFANDTHVVMTFTAYLVILDIGFGFG